MPVTTSEILQQVWSLSEGDYIFMPVMRPGRIWDEGGAFLANKVQGPLWFGPGRPTPTVDNYFTPLKYTELKRRREFVGRPGVLFADLDDGARLSDDLFPNLIVKSSAAHKHAYWFLDRPYDLAEWESKARGLSYAIGADPGGWDTTQVLRVPGTLNHKYSPPHEVTVVYYDPEPRFSLEIFPTHPTPIQASLAGREELAFLPSTEEVAVRLAAMRKYWPRLSLEVQSLLATKQKVSDRSAVIWMVGAALFEAGATLEEAFQIIKIASWNKYRARPKSLMDGLIKQWEYVGDDKYKDSEGVEW